jgi:fucose permease
MRHGSAMSVTLAYAAFVLIGVSAGVGGVLLPAQMRDYGVDQATVGITFFAVAAGFVMAGATSGPLIHRFGVRIALVIGSGGFVLAGLYTATRPSFAVLVALQVITGYATGMMESVLNAYLAALPNPTTLLNRLHAFFGVGALLGPVLATWIVGFTSWPVAWLVMGVACIPLVAGFLVFYPRAVPDTSEPAAGGLLTGALRQRAVLLGATLLTVYVGLEVGIGNWGYSYLLQGRGQAELLAGYTISGYWLGLTLGRFLLGPLVSKAGMSAVGLMFISLTGVAAAAALTWLVSVGAVAIVGLVVLGFFLGPIFPTTMAVVPRLAPARLVPTAIGVMNAGSVVGGAALPWLAGVIIQSAGVWTLLPFTVMLALLQSAVWWPMARRIRASRPAATVTP